MMRASIDALIQRLEKPHALPLSDDTLLTVLSDGEFEQHRFEAEKLAKEQKERYLASSVPQRPKGAEEFERKRLLDVKSRRSRKARRKTILKNMAKLQERLYSHDCYLDEQWRYLWLFWDGLSPEEQAWFNPPATLSDRGPDNLPKPLAVPPITAVIPGEQHFKVQAQIRALRRLLAN
jgi:hypothetical protein